jgi:SAM-dependent methyltransferase
VFVGAADQDHVPPGSVDVVYLWHALEHTHSPTATLAACRRALKPGGTLMMAVPNFGSLQARFWRGSWASVEAPRHLYQFTKPTLRRYLEAAGFSSIQVRTRTGPAVPARGLRITCNRLFGTRWQRDPRWLVGLMEVPIFFSNLVRFLGVGSELRVRCRA